MQRVYELGHGLFGLPIKVQVLIRGTTQYGSVYGIDSMLSGESKAGGQARLLLRGVDLSSLMWYDNVHWSEEELLFNPILQ